MPERPTTDPRLVVLDAHDGIWSQLHARLGGLSDDEYRWAPVDGWSVEQASDGRVEVTGAGHTDPGPFTTIAWRLWHLAVDCLDGYSERLFATTGASVSGTAWHWGADEAVADLERAWANWRAGLAARDADEWWDVLGPHWGPFAEHNLYDLALHAHNELTHHAAEIALLRDLWRSGRR